jgi:hypothetical protein
MPIEPTDIQYRLSGGAANADPNASLGGAISANAIGAGAHNLFDQVSGAESAAGDIEYRCFYVRNAHPTLTLQGAKVFVLTESTSPSTNEELGLGTSAISGVEQTVADESTGPSGVTFAEANGEGAGLVIGDLAPNAHKAVWMRRTVTAGAAALNDDESVIRVVGDTAA